MAPKNFFAALRLRLKRSFDNIKSERLKHNLLQALPFWIGSLVTGLVAVGYARLFSIAEHGTEYIYHHAAWLFFIITPACFLLSWWVVKTFAPYSRGSGIPQVIAAIELANPKEHHKINKLLSIRVAVVKIISSVIMVVGGGVVGREGPTIQIAGSIFRKINEWLPAWWPKVSKRNMIMTGAAAGLAAAFNTPLGGVVFAVEELTKTHISYFKTALFTAVIIAGLTAQAILGPYLYLGYPDVQHVSSWMFLLLIPVAIVAGLAGSGMTKGILGVFRWKSKFRKKWNNVLYVMLAGLALASLAYFVNENVFGSGKEIMTHTLFTADKNVSWYTPLLKMFGSVISFTSGGAGGVFAPALGAGAGIGSVMSGWFHALPNDTNLLILCGMVAFLTGVTRTPFTSAILVLEMTDRHNVIFHLMLAGMIASLVSVIIDKHSFYDHLKHQYKKEILEEEKRENVQTAEEIKG